MKRLRPSLNEREVSPFAVSPVPHLHLDTGAGLGLLRQFCSYREFFFCQFSRYIKLKICFLDPAQVSQN